MKLNPDCIRGILLTVEDKCDFDTPLEYERDNFESEYLAEYSHKEILYHIKQTEESGLIQGVHYYDGGDDVLICDSLLLVMNFLLISETILFGRKLSQELLVRRSLFFWKLQKTLP